MQDSTSRRSFLGAAALAVAASCSAPCAFSQDTDKPTTVGKIPPFRLGVASYSLRKFDVPQVVAALKQLRTPYLNAKEFHLPMNTPEAVKAAAAAYRTSGVTLTGVGTISFTKDDDADVRPKFEYARAAGVPLMVIAPTHEVLPRIEKFVEEYDVRVAIHNHGPEDRYFPSPLDSLKAVRNLDPRMGVCMDVGHTERAGTDPVAAIAACGPRLFAMHMKDLTDFRAKESQVAVGEGRLPTPAIFNALLQASYQGCVDLEYEIHEDNPIPGMVESFAYMRGVLAGMGYTG